MNLLKETIKAEALHLGFSFIGFTKPQQTPHFSAYENWLNEPLPEELEYLKKMYVADSRKEPGILLEKARTVIVLGIGYSKPTLPFAGIDSERKQLGQIAAYVCLPDYHRWFKDRSRELISSLKVITNSAFRSKLFVDSGPVMEKDFAFQAGLGWIGKNSLFISRVYGSFCLLGCLFMDFDLEPDTPDKTDLCGECELCMRSCPTQAISENRTINASRCISFLTMNTRGRIPNHLCELIGDHVFGCDICQSICPLNKGKPDIKLKQNELLSPIIANKVNLHDELLMNERTFLAKYSLTPIGKLSYEVFLRNLILAAGNSGDKSFEESLKIILGMHHSPIIQSAAQWAITMLE